MIKSDIHVHGYTNIWSESMLTVYRILFSYSHDVSVNCPQILSVATPLFNTWICRKELMNSARRVLHNFLSISTYEVSTADDNPCKLSNSAANASMNDFWSLLHRLQLFQTRHHYVLKDTPPLPHKPHPLDNTV